MPYEINILGLTFNIYGLIIGICAASVILFFMKRFERLRVAHIIIVALLTLFGARLLFIINNPDKIQLFFNFTSGGLGFFGAFAGFTAGVFIVSRASKISFLKIMDAAAIIFPIAQAFGRVGNYFNQELYGSPTDIPWAIYIDQKHRLPGYEQFDFFHPAYAYEAILNLILFVTLFIISKRYAYRVNEGQVFSIYLVGYGVIRIFVDLFRIDKEYVFGIENSVLYACIFVLSGVILFLKCRKY